MGTTAFGKSTSVTTNRYRRSKTSSGGSGSSSSGSRKTTPIAVTRPTEGGGTQTVTTGGQVTLRDAEGKVIERYQASSSSAKAFVSGQSTAIEREVQQSVEARKYGQAILDKQAAARDVRAREEKTAQLNKLVKAGFYNREPFLGGTREPPVYTDKPVIKTAVPYDVGMQRDSRTIYVSPGLIGRVGAAAKLTGREYNIAVRRKVTDPAFKALEKRGYDIPRISTVLANPKYNPLTYQTGLFFSEKAKTRFGEEGAGVIEGVLKDIRYRPATTVVKLPAYYYGGKAVGLVTAPILTKAAAVAPIRTKIIGGILAGAYATKVGAEVIAAPTPRARGEVIYKRGVPAGLFIAGAASGAKAFKDIYAKSIKIQVKGYSQQPTRLSGAKTRTVGTVKKQSDFGIPKTGRELVPKDYGTKTYFKKALVGYEYGKSAPAVGRGEITGRTMFSRLKGQYVTVGKNVYGQVYDPFTKQTTFFQKFAPSTKTLAAGGYSIKNISPSTLKVKTYRGEKLLSQRYLETPYQRIPRSQRVLTTLKSGTSSAKVREDVLQALRLKETDITKGLWRTKKSTKIATIGKARQADVADLYVRRDILPGGKEVRFLKKAQIVYSKSPTYKPDTLELSPEGVIRAIKRPTLTRTTKVFSGTGIEYGYDKSLTATKYTQPFSKMFTTKKASLRSPLFGDSSTITSTPTTIKAPYLARVSPPSYTGAFPTGEDITALLGAGKSSSVLPLSGIGLAGRIKPIGAVTPITRAYTFTGSPTKTGTPTFTAPYSRTDVPTLTRSPTRTLTPTRTSTATTTTTTTITTPTPLTPTTPSVPTPPQVPIIPEAPPPPPIFDIDLPERRRPRVYRPMKVPRVTRKGYSYSLWRPVVAVSAKKFPSVIRSLGKTPWGISPRPEVRIKKKKKKILGGII